MTFSDLITPDAPVKITLATTALNEVLGTILKVAASVAVDLENLSPNKLALEYMLVELIDAYYVKFTLADSQNQLSAGCPCETELPEEVQYRLQPDRTFAFGIELVGLLHFVETTTSPNLTFCYTRLHHSHKKTRSWKPEYSLLVSANNPDEPATIATARDSSTRSNNTISLSSIEGDSWRKNQTTAKRKLRAATRQTRPTVQATHSRAKPKIKPAASQPSEAIPTFVDGLKPSYLNKNQTGFGDREAGEVVTEEAKWLILLQSSQLWQAAAQLGETIGQVEPGNLEYRIYHQGFQANYSTVTKRLAQLESDENLPLQTRQVLMRYLLKIRRSLKP